MVRVAVSPPQSGKLRELIEAVGHNLLRIRDLCTESPADFAFRPRKREKKSAGGHRLHPMAHRGEQYNDLPWMKLMRAGLESNGDGASENMDRHRAVCVVLLHVRSRFHHHRDQPHIAPLPHSSGIDAGLPRPTLVGFVNFPS